MVAIPESRTAIPHNIITAENPHMGLIMQTTPKTICIELLMISRFQCFLGVISRLFNVITKSIPPVINAHNPKTMAMAEEMNFVPKTISKPKPRSIKDCISILREIIPAPREEK